MTETKAYQSLKIAYSNNIISELNNSCFTKPYIVTTRFDYIPLSTHSNQRYRFLTNATWTQYAKTYRFVLSNLINNFQNKTYLHPRTYDFFDVDGTRDNPNASFTENTIPHIHSVYLIHEHTLNRFQTLVDSDFTSVVEHPSNKPFVRSIHAKPITDDLPNVVSYCSKFLDVYQARAIRDEYPLFNQFPLPQFEIEALKQEREEQPFHMLVQSNREMKKRFSA